jgi:hypothetical protein
VPGLEAAIDQWLVARDQFKIERSDENQSYYNATLHDLGAAWGERYLEDADTPGRLSGTGAASLPRRRSNRQSE